MEETATLIGFRNNKNFCFMISYVQLLLSSEIIKKAMRMVTPSITQDKLIVPNVGEIFRNIERYPNRCIKYLSEFYIYYTNNTGGYHEYSIEDQVDMGEFSSIFFNLLDDYFESIVIKTETYGLGEDNPRFSSEESPTKFLPLSIRPTFKESIAEFTLEEYRYGAHDEYKVVKKITFSHLPRVLFIQLKRMSSNSRGELVKNSKKMEMPKDIWMIENGIQIPYVLRSVAIHVGSLRSGHYYVHRRIGNSWYCLNDSTIYEIEEPDLETGYFYVYERVCGDPPVNILPTITLNSENHKIAKYEVDQLSLTFSVIPVEEYKEEEDYDILYSEFILEIEEGGENISSFKKRNVPKALLLYLPPIEVLKILIKIRKPFGDKFIIKLFDLLGDKKEELFDEIFRKFDKKFPEGNPERNILLESLDVCRGDYFFDYDKIYRYVRMFDSTL